MSDDHLNDELKKRIAAVFNDYHDDTAEEGWLRLREKYPEKGEDRPVSWLWRMAGLAALLLAFLGIGLWLNFRQSGNENTVAKNKIVKKDSSLTANPAIAKNDQVAGTGANTAYQPINKTPNTSVIKPVTATLASSTIKHQYRYLNNGHKQTNPSVNSNSARLAVYKTTIKAKLPVIQQSPSTALNNSAPDKTIATTNTPLNNHTVNLPANPVITNSNAPTQQATAAVPPAAQNKNIAPAKPDKSIQSLFDNDKYQSAQNNTEPKIKQRTVIFAVYAATYVNYAKGSNKQVNTGGGLTADFRLTDNLSLSTGIGIAQNSLAYNGNGSTSQVSVFPAAVSYSYRDAASSTFSELSPSSQALNASLVNLDIPLNLKYVFNPQKKNVYVAAGLSSGSFINETYKYTYNYATPNSTNVTQSQQDNNKTFDNFYFAKMFNVSFGIGYPLGKNQLIIEPFFKYPINGLGEQHILFGSGGLNLKINFDPPKKSN